MSHGRRAAARGEKTSMLANVNGTTLYYELLGEGPPLMLMHGGLGFDHSYFRPWVDPLAEDFTLILYDHRGNGRSERPPDLKDVVHSTWADDADALRQHLGIDRMILLGQSYGGAIALHYALRYQQHLAGLILATAHPAWDYMDVVLEKARQRGTAEEAAAIERRFFEHLESDEEMANLAATIGGMYFYDRDCAAAKIFGINTVFSARRLQPQRHRHPRPAQRGRQARRDRCSHPGALRGRRLHHPLRAVLSAHPLGHSGFQARHVRAQRPYGFRRRAGKVPGRGEQVHTRHGLNVAQGEPARACLAGSLRLVSLPHSCGSARHTPEPGPNKVLDTRRCADRGSTVRRPRNSQGCDRVSEESGTVTLGWYHRGMRNRFPGSGPRPTGDPNG